MTLPIELVPNTDPPQFTWQQVMDGRAIDHSGMFPPTVEDAIKRLIELANKLTTENAVLRGKMAVQSEMLNKLTTENAVLRGKMAVQSEMLNEGSRNVPKGPITAQPSEEGPVAGTIKPVKKAGK